MKKLIVLLFASALCFSAMAPEKERDWEETWKKRKIELAQQERVDNLLETIRHVESRGRYHLRGRSGEYGAYQFMPGTWAVYSQAYAGERLDITCPDNQDKVARYKIEGLVEEGLSDREIALMWNAGTTDAEGWEGINSQGQYYNVTHYADRFVEHLNDQPKQYINYL